MIVEQITLRVKNIIFFKAVCVCISLLILTYLINQFSDDLTNGKIKNLAALSKLSEEEHRLEALESEDKKLEETIKVFLELKQNQSLNITKDCFDRMSYQNKILEAEKTFGLNDSSTIKVTEQAPSKINKLQQTILLNKTAVLVEYHVNTFTSAIKFAQAVFETMPENTFIKSFDIIKHKSLTPTVVSWLKKSKDPDLISVKVDMELRTIGLSDEK